VALKRAGFYAKRRDLLLLWGLLGEKSGVDVGEDATLGDGDLSNKLGELFIVSDGELEMSWSDSRLFVVSGGVASELDDFGGQVLEDGGHVDGSAGANSVGPVASSKHSVDASDGELESGPAGSRLLGGVLNVLLSFS
jgi:hypothetical protein